MPKRVDLSLDQDKRIPQNTMTNDPDKVWPEGIVRFVCDAKISKSGIFELVCHHRLKSAFTFHQYSPLHRSA